MHQLQSCFFPLDVSMKCSDENEGPDLLSGGGKSLFGGEVTHRSGFISKNLNPAIAPYLSS